MSTETSDHYRPTVIKHVPSLERLDLKLISEDEKMMAVRHSNLTSFTVVDGGVEEETKKMNELENSETRNDLSSETKAQKEELVIADSAVVASKEVDFSDLAVHKSTRIFKPRWYALLQHLVRFISRASYTVLLNSISRLSKFCSLRDESSNLRGSGEDVLSIRETVSHLSLVNKQALAEILHLLPRLNDDALALLANEVANRRRHHEERVSPASSTRVTTP
ncbi:unnamed protein product [Hydatigera taeniaeformis]|uniref:RPAP3_C domain-containing protein n=1 Tax=Hydatigena taeniaeformis TaxID=6205 RepID=A0A0R3X068_HYDTA|nr:unnamed protein product [Hydatigera taeniaeformis]